MTAQLSHGLLQCPLTAVAITSDRVLVGEGPYLKVFDLATKRCVLKSRIFEAQSIHGIAVERSLRGPVQLLLWGGRYIRAAALRDGTGNEPQLVLDRSHVLRCSDWILHAVWAPASHSSCLAITAHNALLHLVISSGAGDDASVNESHLSASTRCLLYSASIKWIGPSEALIAAGTAFGELIIWSCRMEPSEQESLVAASITVHNAFPAHDGSIFGLDIALIESPDETTPGSCLVASCSDDRTIRVWNVAAHSGGSTLADTIISPEAIEVNQIPVPKTSNPGSMIHVSKTSSADLFAKTWAHSSRIWGIRFLQQRARQSLELVSNGEDATCQVWNLDLRPQPKIPAESQRLSNLARYCGHSGKNIWALDVKPAENGHCITSAGADGRVVLVDHRDAMVDGSPNGFDHESTILMNGDSFKSYSFIGPDQLVMTSRRGYVVKAELRSPSIDATTDKTPLFTFSKVTELADLANYSVVVGSEETASAFLSGNSGSVYLYQSDTGLCTKVANVGQKITAMLVQALHGYVHLLCSFIGTPEAVLLSFAIHEGDRIDISTVIETRILLDHGFISTALLLLADQTSFTLFLGSRTGQIVRYQLVLGQSVQTMLPSASIGNHQDAITSMSWASGQASTCGYLMTTARDSTVAIHRVPLHFSDMEDDSAFCVHRALLPFGPNIEGHYIDRDSKDLILYGFRSTSFVVYNETKQLEVASIECGGAHRVWAYRPASDVGGAFVWTKASNIDAHRFNGQTSITVKDGGHGREIKTCAVRASSDDVPAQIFATGAEDTDIRIFEYCNGIQGSRDSFQCIMLARKHKTGIQQLAWSPNGSHLFSCGGSEEFFVWRATKVPFVRFGMVCESEMPPVSELPDLRIMDFAVDIVAKTTETPFTFRISMVFSDSTFCIYNYQPSLTGGEWRAIHTGAYTTCCLTQCLSIGSAAHQELLLAATDGHFLVLKELGQAQSDVAKDLDKFRVHQNAVKDAIVLARSPAESTAQASCMLLASVGDDNALAITRMTLSGDQRPQSSTLLVPRAHAAAVTAMAHLKHDNSSQGEASHQQHYIVTSGNDQIVKLWRIRFDAAAPGVDGVTIDKAAELPTAVADVSSIDILRKTRNDGQFKAGVLVCGVGMETFELVVA